MLLAEYRCSSAIGVSALEKGLNKAVESSSRDLL